VDSVPITLVLSISPLNQSGLFAPSFFFKTCLLFPSLQPGRLFWHHANHVCSGKPLPPVFCSSRHPLFFFHHGPGLRAPVPNQFLFDPPSPHRCFGNQPHLVGFGLGPPPFAHQWRNRFDLVFSFLPPANPKVFFVKSTKIVSFSPSNRCVVFTHAQPLATGTLSNLPPPHQPPSAVEVFFFGSWFLSFRDFPFPSPEGIHFFFGRQTCFLEILPLVPLRPATLCMTSSIGSPGASPRVQVTFLWLHR